MECWACSLVVLVSIVSAVPVELKDDGEGLTGPQPSIVGSIDKVFNKVNKFDSNQCLQKMICEAMGTAENLVVAGVNSQLGQQAGQLAQTGLNQLPTNPNQIQSGINQFQSNPNQFVQNQFNGNNPLVQASTAQLGQNGQSFLQSGQQVLQSGQQLFNSGQQFLQQFPQTNNNNHKFQTKFGSQNQFAQQNQFQQTQFLPQNQISQFNQNQFNPQNQFQQNQVSQFNQNQNQFSQNQFNQNQFSQTQNQFSQNQFSQSQGASGSSGGGGLVDSFVDGLAGMLASVPIGKRRRKRQSSMHGQAIRLMQSLGLHNMGAYPYVRAAIIGHANKASPQSCELLYSHCPSGADQLLSYFNNNNGGLAQSVVPSVTNEVGSLFPGLASLPQVAASTFGEFSNSDTGGQGGGLVNTVFDSIAGFIAGATLPKPSGKEVV